jgi:6,7-dimethyl-8-ribityllumazine synthase
MMELCFIQACWQKSTVDEIRVGFVSEFQRNLPDVRIVAVEVPGILEIPLQAKIHAESGRYAAIVVAGVVTSGGIYKYEYVAHAVITAIVSIQLESEIPIISAILMPLDYSDAESEDYFLRHAQLKGKEAATACLQIIKLMGQHKKHS